VAELEDMKAEEGAMTSELVVTLALVAELEGPTMEEDDESATALDVVAELAPVLAQAKLILVTKAPESFGALRSHVISTYGQQTLSFPRFTISPLTKTVVEVTAAPDFAPELSTSWNEVPA
jgi:hypothetical protein